jgi:hypothetical protein
MSSQEQTYNDHSKDMNVDVEVNTNTRGGVQSPFPEKLFKMLQYIDLHEPAFASIVSWQPDGRCFLVRDAKRFEALVLPRFFKQTMYTSFRRQLNLWGFKRLLQKTSDHGAYYHELFLRSKTYLHRRISRIPQRVRDPSSSPKTTPAKSNSPDSEPYFYSMSPLPHSPFGTTINDCCYSEQLLSVAGGPVGLLNTIGYDATSSLLDIMPAAVAPSRPRASYLGISSSNERAFVPATRRFLIVLDVSMTTRNE